jgi:hypothetical protein
MRFYNKRGTADQWIKEGKQAVKMTQLAATGAVVVERGHLQLGQSVAAAGAAEGNRKVVVDQFATAVGETCPLLLAAVGREPHDQAAVRQHGTTNRGTAVGDRIASRACSKGNQGNSKEARRGVNENTRNPNLFVRLAR